MTGLQSLLEGDLEPGDELVDLALGYRERGRDHDEVAVHAVGVADVGPDDEAGVEGGGDERLRELERARERSFAGLVGDELDAGQKTEASDVADGFKRG